jgi:endonuclease/exonuclease/phosphatase family metal-dependent hydrolase
MNAQLMHSCAEWVQHYAARPFRCFNLNVLASPVPCNRMEGERFACLIEHIREQQYDVVTFQEFIKHQFCNRKHLARYEKFVDSLRSMGYMHDICGPSNKSTLRPLDGGTAIFSKHPFVRCSEHHWQQQASWDAWASKGILHALIDVMPPVDAMALPPLRMHVITLHAQAAHVGWQDTAGADKYRRVRMRQMRQLAQVIKSEAADGEPVIVMGDFNFDARILSELCSHQAELSHDTGRKCLPVDVVAATFDGDHPATFGWRTEEGELAEPFLTTTEEEGIGQSLDHVYYWPKEGADIPKADGIWNRQHSYITSVSEPKCSLEPCPYNGPSGSDGKSPFHVSDHCGWSVATNLTWTLRPDVENALHPQPASLLPIDYEEKRLSPPSVVQVEKACKHNSYELHDATLAKGSRLTTYWLLCWLVYFSVGQQSLLNNTFGR